MATAIRRNITPRFSLTGIGHDGEAERTAVSFVRVTPLGYNWAQTYRRWAGGNPGGG